MIITKTPLYFKKIALSLEDWLNELCKVLPVNHGETGQWETLMENRKKRGETVASHSSASCSQQKKFRTQVWQLWILPHICVLYISHSFLSLVRKCSKTLLLLCVTDCLGLSKPFHIFKEIQYSGLSFFTAVFSWHVASGEKDYLLKGIDIFTF